MSRRDTDLAAASVRSPDLPTDLSVIIVNWNGGQALLACVESAFRATQAWQTDVWLVDNASVDGSAERAAAAHPQLHIIRGARNIGFAAAVNRALEHAAGHYILLLNPDARITAEAIDRLLAVMRQDGTIGIAGCPSVDRRGRASPAFESSFPGRRRRTVAQSGAVGDDVAWVSGACLLARRRMIDDIGPLDEGFFMYYEDVDWCYRARQAGWRVVTVRDARVEHDLGGSAQRVPAAETARRAASSRLRFYEKHYSRWAAGWLKLRMLGCSLLGTARWLLPAAVPGPARAALACELARLRAVTHRRPRRKDPDGSTVPVQADRL